MSTPINVLVVSPTGHTSQSVIEGLLNSTTVFNITALTRESSLSNPILQQYKDRGVKVLAADLRGPRSKLVEILTGIDVVISGIYWQNFQDQIPLAEAAKEAGVKRFVPSSFQTATPRGVMELYDRKEEILAAIQRMKLPWTSIDVGWWAQGTVQKVPSGRTDPWVNPNLRTIPGDGNVPSAFMDRRDIGKWVAKIIADQRTLNRKVFAYTEILTFNDISDILDEISGEKSERVYWSADEMLNAIKGARPKFDKDPSDPKAALSLLLNQYTYSYGVRGDNTPEAAEIYGYLDATKLYPDVGGITIRNFFEGIFNGSEKA